MVRRYREHEFFSEQWNHVQCLWNCDVRDNGEVTFPVQDAAFQRSSSGFQQVDPYARKVAAEAGKDLRYGVGAYSWDGAKGNLACSHPKPFLHHLLSSICSTPWVLARSVSVEPVRDHKAEMSLSNYKVYL